MSSETQSERETRLIEENMGLVISLAKKFYPKNREEFEDLKQIGSIGLLKAIRTLNNDKSRLSTWAYQRIRWEIIRYISGVRCDHTPIGNIAEPFYWSNESIHPYLPDCLNDSERQVVLLRSSNYNLREISEIMDLNPNTVARLMKQAAQKIKDADG